MTATPTSPQLQDMLAPGQEEMIDGFLEELEQEQQQLNGEQPADEQGEQLLAGKFKSTEELEKAYLEAQKLISQRGQQQQSEPEPQPQLTPDQYTPELGKQLYGDTVATAIEAAEINPLEMAEKVYAGQDVSSYVDALVNKGGLPREVVETYLQGVSPAKAPAQQQQQSDGFTDADIAELKAMVGGDEQFQQLSQWAVANLDPQELADYNAAVDSGNKAAARFALRQLKVRAAGGSQGGEPKLISGGAPPRGDVFESDQQAVDARSKRDKNGRFLYETDPKYRQWYDKTLARSNVFV